LIAAWTIKENYMRPMPLTLSWSDFALRLALTLVAGALLGYNRSEHGRSAGLRTTLLVCLAASVAMLQANLLLPTAGKPPGGFAVADVLRFPLGILSGIGFIGAGAIVRRRDIVIGVTTAANLWFATVVGLTFGGGQLALGAVATALGVGTLWPLRLVEDRFILQDRRAILSVVTDLDGPAAPKSTRTLPGQACGRPPQPSFTKTQPALVSGGTTSAGATCPRMSSLPPSWQNSPPSVGCNP
jgi:putative Mg2+ transporter-C (MgtC) family protein